MATHVCGFRDSLVVEVQSGSRLDDCLRAARQFCREFSIMEVRFVHNGRKCIVTHRHTKYEEKEQ